MPVLDDEEESRDDPSENAEGRDSELTNPAWPPSEWDGDTDGLSER